jgi:hypothetical protein
MMTVVAVVVAAVDTGHDARMYLEGMLVWMHLLRCRTLC